MALPKPRRPSEISLSAPGGGEGRGEVEAQHAPHCGLAHLTLPVAEATAPLSLRPQAGGKGDHSPRESRG